MRARPLPPMFLAFAVAAVLAWWWPNRPVTLDAPPIARKIASLSFAPFRAGQSPVTDVFPTAAEVDDDAALVATRARGIRSYAAFEGDYDLPAIARRHGLTLWQGIWLGSDRAQNAREVARGAALANANPGVVTRVVVGNEVLLRRDLPPAELIAAIDQVRAAVRVPVTYADVDEFWRSFPEVADHVDIVTIHMLPYWEDSPTSVDDAVPHIARTLDAMRALFPGKEIAIGEAGWPSRGRTRQGAVPSRVNEATFFRRFIAFAERERVDYNLIEAFDQVWKAGGEGTVGANWGFWTPSRAEKFGLSGPVVENPGWPLDAGLTVLAALMLTAATFLTTPDAARVRVAVVAMGLGAALAFAWAGTVPDVTDRFQAVAACGNLAGQAWFAVLVLRRVARPSSCGRALAARTGRDATEAVRALLRCRVGFVSLDTMSFLFAWAAALLQILLVVDPRYRDFPLATFAVPLVAVVVRAALGDLSRGGCGREEAAIAAVLVVGAIASAIQEGPLNTQSLVWNAAAVVLAIPCALRLMPAGRQARAAAAT